MKRENDSGSDWWKDEYYLAKREDEDREAAGDSLGHAIPEDLWKRLRAREIEGLKADREAANRRRAYRAMLRATVARAREEGRDIDEAVAQAIERFLSEGGA